MPSRLDIVLTNSADGIYYPGQELIGDVIVEFDKCCKVSKLALTISGKGKTKWYERRGARHHYTVTYRGKEQHLHSQLVLFQSHDKSVEIAPGAYKHGFACRLPETLPASLEAKRGHIRYWLVATLERPWRTARVKSLNFQVVRRLDLNHVMLSPVREEIIENIGYWPCMPTGALYASVELPTSGFVPGQFIPAVIQINNKSRNKITKIVTMLVQKITYNAQKPEAKQKVKRMVACRNVTPEITLPEGGILAAENLQVPWLLPTSTHTHVVQIGYELVVEFRIESCLSNATQRVRVPVVIGVIPARDSNLMESNAIRVWSKGNVH
ncbi:arrestin domain-containing protein 17-like [Toxorhynchites rutilus septentrionalis]|uniref:arrestin domain-containing protein 17-like n=1 Tax=Toxorhynchites rutilus septentrionalis TaxID=329112 RepID=UPI00247A84A4|nr:arrestin domain-containing protein 17-like [Toxorhynchites rutilus septentrionalis]